MNTKLQIFYLTLAIIGWVSGRETSSLLEETGSSMDDGLDNVIKNTEASINQDLWPFDNILNLYQTKTFSNCRQLKKIKKFACNSYKYLESTLTPEEVGILGLTILMAAPDELRTSDSNNLGVSIMIDIYLRKFLLLNLIIKRKNILITRKW